MRHKPSTAARIALALLLLVAAPLPAGAADPAAIQSQLNKTVSEYHKLENQLAQTEARLVALEEDLAKSNEVIAQKSAALKSRAGYLYKYGGVGTYLENLIISGDIRVFLRRVQFLALMTDEDERIVESLLVTKGRADEVRSNLQSTRSRQRSLISQMRNKRRELELQFKGAVAAAKVGRFGKFDSFTLPMSPSAFVNSWGDPRSGGRRHAGTDVMGPCGAPVVAVTNGSIQDLSSGGNGGIMLYLRATNGDVFFYAHLKGYAPGIHQGKRVSTGELIAYNGNTGNARGGPCHIHFEWHPDGGRPVNPYPLLAAVR